MGDNAMNIYVLAPLDSISGGPELAHQFCGAVNSMMDGANVAKICYVDATEMDYKNFIGIDAEVPEVYRSYVTEHAVGLQQIDQPGNIIVVPEGLSFSISVIEHARVWFWWMSVDNYVLSTKEVNLQDIIARSEYHLVQSQYAREYIGRYVEDTNRILWLTDYINDAHGQFLYPSNLRRDMVLYNPKKGYKELAPFIERGTEYQWVPLIHLDLEQEIVLMQSAKLYIDFGEHPGRDRIPREAAANGCCVITNRKGSARNGIDVPIPSIYKWENPKEDMDAILELMADICHDFQKHQDAFAPYRKEIKGQKAVFLKEVAQLLQRV